MGKFTFGLETAKNIDYIKKCFKQKLHKINFLKKKLTGCISLCTPRMELGDSKDLCFWNIIMRRNEKVHFQARNCKNTDYIEKCFKQRLPRIKFPKKNSVDAYLYLLQEEVLFENKLILFYCFILIRFSATITINFYRFDKIYDMIFEWMYIFRSQ